MLLINDQQQVVGWFDRVKDMEKKEGDTVIKTKKDADAAGFGEQWTELRPKKEKAERSPRVTTREGTYKVVSPEKLKDNQNAERSAALEMLKNGSDVATFLTECKGYTTEKGLVNASSILSYALRRGIVELV